MTRSFVNNAISFIPFLALVLPVSGVSHHGHRHHNRAQYETENHMNSLNKRGLPATPSGWTLTWADDFSGSAGTSPSSSNWIFDIGTKYPGGPDNWGTGEIQYYTQSTDNVYIDGLGNMIIVPRKSSSGDWTSARLETKRTFQCAAGSRLRIEARIRLPTTATSKQQGIWPAFWAMGKSFRDNGYDGWPGTGEIDIMEAVNGLGSAFNTVHCGVYPGGPCNEPNGISKQSSFSRSAFRTFSMTIDRTNSNWQNQFISWAIDGVESYRVVGSQIGSQSVWQNLAQREIFVLLNVAVGGALPNAIAGQGVFTPNDNTVGGADSAMVIDYVAAYNFGTPPPTTTTTRTTTRSTTTAATTTSPGTVVTPTPIQAGQAQYCVGWRYIQPSDTCANLVTRYSSIGLTLNNLVAWNPALGTASNCVPTPGYFVCVQRNAPPPANPTPSPIQNNQVTNCGGWRYVQPSDTCANLVSRYASINLSLSNLVTWNPALGNVNNCRPTAGFYVCVVLKVPTPVQANQVQGCEGWRYTQSSDTCANIVSRYSNIGLTLQNLVRWNPALGTTSNCRITAGFYVCVRV